MDTTLRNTRENLVTQLRSPPEYSLNFNTIHQRKPSANKQKIRGRVYKTLQGGSQLTLTFDSMTIMFS